MHFCIAFFLETSSNGSGSSNSVFQSEPIVIPRYVLSKNYYLVNQINNAPVIYRLFRKKSSSITYVYGK